MIFAAVRISADSRFYAFYAILLEMLGVVWYNHSIGILSHGFYEAKNDRYGLHKNILAAAN